MRSFAIDRFGASSCRRPGSITTKVVYVPGARGERPFLLGPPRPVDPPSSVCARPPESSEKHHATTALMMNSRTVVESLSSSDLLSATRELVQRSRGVEEELLVHLAEIDERRLYFDRAFSSMFAFCGGELGFSEDAACNRINVARAARRLPVILEAVRSGQVHLTGLRLLAPHLTTENQSKVLAEAAGKSKREIEELVARLSPQPPVPTVVRKLPDRSKPTPEASPAFAFGTPISVAPPQSSPALDLAPSPTPPPPRDERPAVIAPLSEETFKFQFTASRACRDKLRQAQDLLRHRMPDGDLGTIFEKALDLLIEQVKKERFATGRKARQAPSDDADESRFASHPRRHQARGLRARRWPLHVRRRAWPQVRRNWRPGIRSPGRVRANASPPSGPDPPALPCAQSARRGADVRSRVHATSARLARPASNSSGDSFRDLTRCGPRRGGLNPDPEMLEVIHGGSRSKSGSESWST